MEPRSCICLHQSTDVLSLLLHLCLQSSSSLLVADRERSPINVLGRARINMAALPWFMREFHTVQGTPYHRLESEGTAI